MRPAGSGGAAVIVGEQGFEIFGHERVAAIGQRDDITPGIAAIGIAADKRMFNHPVKRDQRLA